MKYVQAFITNISFPTTDDELFDYGCRFDMEKILGVMSEEELDDEKYCQTEGWTVPRWAKKDDIVFFFHAKTANAKISRLVTKLRVEKDIWDKENYWYMMNSLNRAKAIWREYGGKIFAVGKVSGSLFRYKNYDLHHSRSTTFAPINSIFLLEYPIDIAEFNDQIMVSRQSPITPIYGKDFDYLKSLIVKKNKDIWEYLEEAISQPVPLTKITKENWLTVINPYRRSFINEAQFRAYYVDYLLPMIGDRKKIYKECRCKKKGQSITWIDNVIHINGNYLPVEVKLSISLERDLQEQCDQYIFADQIDLNKEITIDGREVLPYVMVIDTEDIYIYDGKNMNHIHALDDLKSYEMIEMLKGMIKRAVMV